MAFQLNKNDLEILSFLAEARALTVTQIAAFQARGNQVARRRLRALTREGLIYAYSKAIGKSRGRPEKIVHLTETGIGLLRSKLKELDDIPNHWLAPPSHHRLQHQLLVNWFRIHLIAIGRVFPQLSIRIISSHSSLSFGSIPLKHKDSESFAPDLVFLITHNERQKTLLFFLEADRGTESIAGVSRGKGDIRKKILNYQLSFQSEQYKAYETSADCKLNGFRLLFLTTSTPHLASLCNLVKSMASSDFIWLTTVDQMFSEGLSARIWFRGGRQDNTLQESILGPEMACRAPLPLRD